MKVENFDNFFKQIEQIYNKLPKREKTFMEISGYPHYENVCSNILAFYLNPREEHNLKDIVLNTLLEIIKEKDGQIDIDVSLSNINIFREYTTEKGNRLDIVLENEEIAIGIENKIYAKVYNDLEDYSKTIEKLNKNSAQILLSINKEEKAVSGNKFINITYNEFFEKLKANLEKYSDTKNKWYIYLLDFIKNIEGFEVERNMEEELNEWLKEHKNEITKLYEILNIAKENINKKTNEYGNVLEGKITKDDKVRYWHGDDVQTTAYIALKIGCNLDANLTVDGWKIGVFMWRKSSQTKIKQTLKENGYDIIEEENNHAWLCKFDYDSDIKNVTDKAKELLDTLKSIN